MRFGGGYSGLLGDKAGARASVADSSVVQGVDGAGRVAVLLCDNQVMFAESLAATLCSRGHQVRAVTGGATETVEAVRDAGANVCVLDLLLDEPAAAHRLQELRRLAPQTKMLLLSATMTDSGWAAFDAGLLDGLVAKTCDVDVVESAIRRVAAGQRVVEGWSKSPTPLSFRRPGTPSLTHRERQILDLIMSGETTGSMADLLGVAESTVRAHVQSVLRKLGVHTRVKAAVVGSGLTDGFWDAGELAPVARVEG
jgi:DNA-binding NarL/FixJ family response regulator